MSDIITPHFDYPFRRGEDGHIVCNEQSSDDDVIAQVQAVVRTPLGYRLELPDFGVESQVLDGQINAEDIRVACETWVSQADFIINVTDDEVDHFIKHVLLGIKTKGET